MAPPTVFVTGVTGFVGGDALFAIHQAHPDWHYRFLVRSPDKGAAVKAAFPASEAVVGSLAATELLTAEAERADIVINFATSDVPPAVEALIAGLAAHEPSRPGYLIHISGTGMLTFADTEAARFGEPDDTVWADDEAGLAKLLSFPDAAVHRNVEKVVMGPDFPPNVRRVLLSPPTIVGTGRGPANQRSIQLPIMIEMARRHGRAVQVGRGLAVWNFVAVSDLSQLVLQVAEDAARGGSDGRVWGRAGGYFFVENGERSWGSVTRRVAQRLHTRLPAQFPDPDAVDALPMDQASAIDSKAFAIAANSRSKAIGARSLLGWQPLVADFDPLIDLAVDYELDVATQSRSKDFDQGKSPAF